MDMINVTDIRKNIRGILSEVVKSKKTSGNSAAFQACSVFD